MATARQAELPRTLLAYERNSKHDGLVYAIAYDTPRSLLQSGSSHGCVVFRTAHSCASAMKDGSGYLLEDTTIEWDDQAMLALR